MSSRAERGKMWMQFWCQSRSWIIKISSSLRAWKFSKQLRDSLFCIFGGPHDDEANRNLLLLLLMITYKCHPHKIVYHQTSINCYFRQQIQQTFLSAMMARSSFVRVLFGWLCSYAIVVPSIKFYGIVLRRMKMKECNELMRVVELEKYFRGIIRLWRLLGTFYCDNDLDLIRSWVGKKNIKPVRCQSK